MNALGFLVVGIGAATGAWLRWWLNIVLNPVFPVVPLGTLAANLCGGLLMGIAMEFLRSHPAASPEVRLAVTTGFLGGFTTFSAFSAEVVTLFAQRQPGWAMTVLGAHVIGSLLLTAAGMAIAYWIFQKGSP